MATPDPRCVGGCARCGSPDVQARLRVCVACGRDLVRRVVAYESVLVTGLAPGRTALAVRVAKN
jgi:hypothetical protein